MLQVKETLAGEHAIDGANRYAALIGLWMCGGMPSSKGTCGSWPAMRKGLKDAVQMAATNAPSCKNFQTAWLPLVTQM